jgi:predicted TIM-barrel fold metal-dependent hydrolase
MTAFGALLSFLGTPTGLAGEALPIFDAHVHYSDPAWVSYAPRSVIDVMDRSAVTRALVSSTPDDGTLMLLREAPDRFVPFLRPYRSSGDMFDWVRNPEILRYLEKRLQTGRYRGIGEFHLMDEEQVRTPQVARIVELAVERDLLLFVHVDVAPVRALFAVNAKLEILWAHAGVFASPTTVGAMMDRYPKLWAELSIRVADIAPGGQLDPGWRALFLRHPTRFLVGTDTWTSSRWSEYLTLVEQQRAWLAQLPREVAQKIAYGNAERIFRVRQ